MDFMNSVSTEISNLFDLTDENYGLFDDFEQDCINCFEKNGISEFSIDSTNPFNSPGLDVYVVSVAWIEDGHLETMLFDMYIN